jgi:uncharacterized RDD family membrane protein YckC
MPAGWYADPAPPNPAFPTTMRYWDGAAWTAQTRGASRKELAASREAAYVAQAQAAAAHAEHVALLQEQGIYEPGPMAASSRDYTPDGQLLARWGRRFSAQLIDWVITCVIAAVVGWSFVSKISSAWSGYVQDSLDAARTGVPAPDASALSSSIAGPAASFGLVYLAVLFLYGVLFLKLFAATPGKMAVGTQVRLRDAPGPLGWRTVLVHWFVQNLGVLARLVPLLGLVSWVYSLLDGLWPLWDPHRQALHDKAARTNVVRR